MAMWRTRSLHLAAIAVLLLLGALHIDRAAATCIHDGDANSIHVALLVAASSGSPEVIKIEQGTYYFGQVDIETIDLTADLRIEGGYIPTNGHTCDEKALDASKTTLLFDGNRLVLDNTPGALTAFDTLTVGSPAMVGGGVALYGNTIELTNVRVTNQTDYRPVVLGHYHNSSTDIKLTNVQFDELIPSTGGCSVYMEGAGHAHAVINHATVDLSRGDFCVDAGGAESVGSKHIALWNSIFWDWLNPGQGGAIRATHDLSDDPIAFEVNAVDYTDFHLAPTDAVPVFNPDFPSIQLDPGWMNPAGGDYSIGNSVAANSGTTQVPQGEPDKDILGADRGIGSAPDMGAHESPFDDIAGGSIFTVTNTNDVVDTNSPLYPGSLRAAMDKAFASNSGSLIKFSLPSCPGVITLNSPLPSVWEPLTLDGYTMAGAMANSDPSGFFNATLCVAIKSASTAATPTALLVTSGGHDASLTVKGIGFGGFSEAIQLWGGHSHQIVGNQFGGVMNGVQLFGFDMDAIRIETSGSVIVGGSSPADHNNFQNAGNAGGDGAAVLVGLFTNNTQTICQIVGNLFGITPDGFSAIPNNKYGIMLQGNGCLVQGNRMAGNIKDAIYILGGSNHVIQNNVIGSAMFFGQDFSNPGAGIRIAAGGANNIIGAPPGFGGLYYANVIKDMDLGGVLIGGDGVGNSVRGNQITQNGLSTGLNLDLGLDGVTANDPGDIDTGVNELMNYPQPYAFAWTNGPPVPGTFNIGAEIKGLLDLAPGDYQIDAYYDHGCSPTGSGGGGWVGTMGPISVPPGVPWVSFELFLVIPDFDAAHGKVSLTATRVAEGQNSTSEFSRCLSVDTIFRDVFEK
jgi:hypothetical protein